MTEIDPTQSRIGAVLERAGEAIGNIKDSLNSRTAVLLIGGVGLVGGGVAAANQLEAEPAFAADAPVAEDTTAEARLQQTCVDANIKIKNPTLSGPKRGYGDGTEYRTFRAQVSYDAMSTGCERFNRYIEPILQTQLPKKPGSWRRTGTDGAFRDDGAESYKKSEDILSIYPGYPKCIDGPRKIKARILYKSFLRSKETNEIVARKSYIKPVKVKGAC